MTWCSSRDSEARRRVRSGPKWARRELEYQRRCRDSQHPWCQFIPSAHPMINPSPRYGKLLGVRLSVSMVSSVDGRAGQLLGRNGGTPGTPGRRDAGDAGDTSGLLLDRDSRMRLEESQKCRPQQLRQLKDVSGFASLARSSYVKLRCLQISLYTMKSVPGARASRYLRHWIYPAAWAYTDRDTDPSHALGPIRALRHNQPQSGRRPSPRRVLDVTLYFLYFFECWKFQPQPPARTTLGAVTTQLQRPHSSTA